MKPRLINLKSLLVVAMVLLLVSSILPVRIAYAISRSLNHTVTAFLQPATDGIKRVSDTFGRPSPDAQHEDGERVREDRDRLLSYSRQLEQELEKANQMLQEYTRVGQQARLKGAEFLPAGVTAYSDPGRNPMLTINRGQQDGIEKGWMVISASGPNLVGWIAAVPGAVTSTVRLITAPRTLLTVQILPPVAGPPPPRDVVQIEAAFTGPTAGKEFWGDDIKHPEQFNVGDVAYLKDDHFAAEAAGKVVGRVVDITNNPNDPLLRRRLIIRPEQRLMNLSQVIVIVPPEAQRSRGNP